MITKKPLDSLGYSFIDPQYLPKGKSQNYLRDININEKKYRNLTASEIEELVRNRNTSDNWNNIFVAEKFNAKLVRDCQFFGIVRIGALEEVYLEYHDLKLPVGLYKSKIISCDFGDNVAIENVNYIAHYQIGSETTILNVNEMACSPTSKFGNGVVKEGQPESIRIWLELCNENGGRKVLPFDGLLSGDAYLWSKYRDDQPLLDKFREFTENEFDNKHGHYGIVGEKSIIKHCKVIKNVKIGDYAYLKGANKLKNLTINSTENARTQIGEGVELVNGIIGYGCRVFYGVKAVRFVMGTNSSLKYGARLINSYLSDNATVSCCEVLNSLIFPGHEQHHNNSFLCAAVIMGQSNMAAGATIGSNHNSRGNDGEIVAGRGFWPGLCVSLKHNSRFASFTILSKGDYPAELNVQLPFSLLINDEAEGALKILPGYWFLYNMYALARNSWKYHDRDKRFHKIQHLEYDFLAPDSVDEIFNGLTLLEKWAATSFPSPDQGTKDFGRNVLNDKKKATSLLLRAHGVESSSRPVIVLKPYRGYQSLIEAVILYATKVLVLHGLRENWLNYTQLKIKLGDRADTTWINVGGQLMPADVLDQLKTDVKIGVISSWKELHNRYQKIGDNYVSEKAAHALKSIEKIAEIRGVVLTDETFKDFIIEGVKINNKLMVRTIDSRRKDYENPYRKMVYDNEAEMDAVIGKFEENEFIEITKNEAVYLEKKVAQFLKLKKLDLV